MASIRLNLKRPQAERTAIVCALSDGRKYKIKLFPGITVKTKHWSKKNQNVLSADSRAVVINNYLREYTSKVFDIYLKAKITGIIPDREYFAKRLAPDEPSNERTFWGVWELYVKSKNGTVKSSTIAKFGSVKKHLNDFEKEYKTQLSFEIINIQFFEDFQNFLYHKQNLNTGTTQRYIKFVRMFLNWCLKRKYITNIDFRDFKAIQQPDTLKVIISDEDTEKLRKFNAEDKNYLNNVRDLFLLSCSCGLRFGDFSRISTQHLKKNDDGYFLEIRQEKTEDMVSIPLTDDSLKTVQDLISGKVHALSNQKMNQYVKELCELAGIDEPFEIHHYKGRDKTSEVVPKYSLVSTHTGRRTFATNLLERGVPAEVVMKFTGHKDYRSFIKYVNIPQKSQMKIVKEALQGNTKNM
jgi:site-specific recombinase XerD